jgi:hypothetical protein
MFPDVWQFVAAFVTMRGVQAIVLIVTAIATAGSVITALVISTRAERRQDPRDRIESTAGLERRAERQAVLVKTANGGEAVAGLGDGIAYLVEVANLSDLPIFTVEAALILVVDGKRDRHAAKTVDVLFGPDRTTPQAFAASIGVPVEVVGADAMFTDAYGDRWSLHSDGTLVLVAARTIRDMYQFSVRPLTRRQRRVPRRVRQAMRRAAQANPSPGGSPRPSKTG